MSTDRARHFSPPFRHRQYRRALLGAACAVGLACALVSSPAVAAKPTIAAKANSKVGAKINVDARAKVGAKINVGAKTNVGAKINVGAKAKARAKINVSAKHKHKETERVSKEPFGNIPQGPLQIIISIDQQKLHLYSDGMHVADALVATGVTEHPTPLGVFSVIDKERYHESNIYSGAPMPYMQRITWSGVALHQGVGVGHRASHGCIRMPEEFAARLWVLHSLGARVIIARPELKPEEFADARLFVHKEPPPPAPTATAPAAVEAVKTAETIDSSKTTDAVAPSMPDATVDGAADASASVPTAKSVAADPLPSKEITDTAADPPPAVLIDAKPTAAESEPAKLDPPSAQPPPGKPAESAIDGVARPAIDAALEAVPVPLPKPADLVRGAIGAPIAIFVSRRTSRIYVRQHFSPLFDAAITIAHPEQPLGTHVFTAMEYLDDGASFRWNVISLPGEPPVTRNSDSETRSEKSAKAKRREERDAKLLDPPPPQTPHQALARIDIPQDVIDRICALMAAGSSLVVSDQGLGEETGEGTDFIVVTR